MRTVRISDITLKLKSSSQLTFKEKLELAKLLDKLGVDVIEADRLSGNKADALCIKSFAQIVKTSTIAVAVAPDKNNIYETWNALKGAQKARLQLTCPVSSVQMEYLYHVKPDKLKEMLQESITYCKSLTEEVEFVAQDATRSDRAFLYEILSLSIKAGAKYISVCDDAGNMLPDEYKEFINDIKANVAGIDDEESIKENILKLIPICEKNKVRLSIKTTGIFADTRRLRTFLDGFASDWLVVTWDMHHPYYDFKESADTTIKSLGAYVEHVHLRDSSEDGSYTVIGEGTLPIDEMLQALYSIDYAGFISLEWKPEWIEELSDYEFIFPHFVNFMENLDKSKRRKKNLYLNHDGTGYYVWKKDEFSGVAEE